MSEHKQAAALADNHHKMRKKNHTPIYQTPLVADGLLPYQLRARTEENNNFHEIFSVRVRALSKEYPISALLAPFFGVFPTFCLRFFGTFFLFLELLPGVYRLLSTL
jgi:hypothetical protein